MPETQLHTDGLEQRYGTVTALVRQHSEIRRVIDIIDSKGISRTHAITWFPQDVHDGIDDMRREVAQGALVGKTFRQHGFSVEKIPLIEGVITLPEWLQERFQSDTASASVSIYEFWGLKEDMRVLYGIVAEIYSPDFMPVTDDDCRLNQIQPSSMIDANLLPQMLSNYLSEITSSMKVA